MTHIGIIAYNRSIERSQVEDTWSLFFHRLGLYEYNIDTKIIQKV